MLLTVRDIPTTSDEEDQSEGESRSGFGYGVLSTCRLGHI